MKYGIISLNSFSTDCPRWPYKQAIAKNVPYEQSWLPAFNAHVFDPLEGMLDRGLELWPCWRNPKRGELGVWLSNYDRWKQASEEGDLIVFEDDAVVDETFTDKFNAFMNELPDDWDFAALWVPEDQRIDFMYDLVYEKGIPRISGMRHPDQSLFRIEGAERAALVYQGYGMVSLVYSQKGATKLVELAHEYGITGPVDCWIYEQAHMNNLKGFAPRPDFADIVTYDWSAESHVQLTERVT